MIITLGSIYTLASSASLIRRAFYLLSGFRMSSHGSIPAPYAILSKVLSETLPFPEITYSSVVMGIPISFAYFACVMFRSYIFFLRFSANARLLSKSFISYLVFQLAHIHIAAPEISSMTAIIALPPSFFAMIVQLLSIFFQNRNSKYQNWQFCKILVPMATFA